MIYIIDFADDASNAAIEQYLTDNNITKTSVFNALGKVYLVESATLPPSDPIVMGTLEDSALPIIPLEVQYRTFPVNEEDQNWWKLATVNVKDFAVPTISHAMNTANVDVYVFDGGIMASHSEFAGVSIENVYSYDGNWNDVSGHGTSIASIIGGNTCALSTANLKNVKIFGETTTYQSHLLAALDAVITHSNANTNASIINMSWHIPKNAYVEAKMKKLVDNDVLIVCSAGNSGQPIENVTPASMTDAITVGAYNKDFRPCDFSNYTAPIDNTQNEVNYGAIDVWAPGEAIYVATLDGGYMLTGGTSIAAAIETASLAYAIGDGMTINEVPVADRDYFRLRGFYDLEGSSRDGVLVLEGKYADSLNKIASMNSQYVDDRSYQTRFLTNVGDVVQSNDAFKKYLFFPRFSGSMTVNTPLPIGVTIQNGWLIGTITVPEDQQYAIHEINITHTSPDGQFTAEQVFRLVVMQVGVTPEMVPENDEVLNYSLDCGSPYYGWGYCGSMCSPWQYCVDYQFYCNGSKSFSCGCHQMCA